MRQVWWLCLTALCSVHHQITSATHQMMSEEDATTRLLQHDERGDSPASFGEFIRRPRNNHHTKRAINQDYAKSLFFFKNGSLIRKLNESFPTDNNFDYNKKHHNADVNIYSQKNRLLEMSRNLKVDTNMIKYQFSHRNNFPINLPEQSLTIQANVDKYNQNSEKPKINKQSRISDGLSPNLLKNHSSHINNESLYNRNAHAPDSNVTSHYINSFLRKHNITKADLQMLLNSFSNKLKSSNLPEAFPLPSEAFHLPTELGTNSALHEPYKFSNNSDLNISYLHDVPSNSTSRNNAQQDDVWSPRHVAEDSSFQNRLGMAKPTQMIWMNSSVMDEANTETPVSDEMLKRFSDEILKRLSDETETLSDASFQKQQDGKISLILASLISHNPGRTHIKDKDDHHEGTSIAETSTKRTNSVKTYLKNIENLPTIHKVLGPIDLYSMSQEIDLHSMLPSGSIKQNNVLDIINEPPASGTPSRFTFTAPVSRAPSRFDLTRLYSPATAVTRITPDLIASINTLITNITDAISEFITAIGEALAMNPALTFLALVLSALLLAHLFTSHGKGHGKHGHGTTYTLKLTKPTLTKKHHSGGYGHHGHHRRTYDTNIQRKDDFMSSEYYEEEENIHRLFKLLDEYRERYGDVEL